MHSSLETSAQAQEQNPLAQLQNSGTTFLAQYGDISIHNGSMINTCTCINNVIKVTHTVKSNKGHTFCNNS